MGKPVRVFADSPRAMACFFLALKIATYSSGTRRRYSRPTTLLTRFADRGLAID